MRLGNGTIMILGPDDSNVGRKVFDLKITQTFPIISIDRRGSYILSKGFRKIDINEYDHFSIPTDLNLHLTSNTGKQKHLKFKTELVDYRTGFLKINLLHLFTWMSCPISFYQQPHGIWYQAEIIFPPKDSLYTESTGIFIDFFVHNYSTEEKIKSYKLFDSAMRLVGDNSGYIIGPYEFSDLIRGNHSFSPKFLFSLRFGFYENHENNSKIYIPFEISEDGLIYRIFWEKLKNLFV